MRKSITVKNVMPHYAQNVVVVNARKIKINDMGKDNFVWTDELVHEFAMKVKVVGHNDWITPQLEAFKASHSDVRKDWEIVEWRSVDGNGNGWVHSQYDAESCQKHGCVINKVRRISDGVVFSVGDKIYWKYSANPNWVIQEFFIKQDGALLVRSKDCGHVEEFGNNIHLSKLPPERTKLFTTEDGANIYEGDEWWCVMENWEVVHLTYARQRYDSRKSFSTEEKAKEYIIMNKPCLSVNDVLKLDMINPYGKCVFSREDLKQLAKSKLK